MAEIVLKNVSKSFGDSEIIKNIDLTIEDGKCTVLVGPSGCGKSTMLRIICGLEEVTDGEIFIGNRFVNDIPPASRGLAMVFQSYALYPHMTVFENMAFALYVRKLKKAEIQERVINAAKILKIDNLLHRKPKELSGGQRQRVAIGRAIVRNPFAFLFDEPLSNLDSGLRCQMRYELAALKAQLKTTMVYVTHDQAEAMTLADKIVVMKDGKIEQMGSPLELYRSPVNAFVAKFIGSSEMNIFPVIFKEYVGKLARFQIVAGNEVSVQDVNNLNLIPGTQYYIGVRPEHIEIIPNSIPYFGNKLDATVQLSENLGGEEVIHITAQENLSLTFKAKQQDMPVSMGDSIRIGFAFDRCYLFDEQYRTLRGINQGKESKQD